MTTTRLDIKCVGEIRGHFIVPAYQRGYRWTKDEIVTLLSDILPASNDNPKQPAQISTRYCLQPVVVKKTQDNTFELIDGQQRLTTLYLLLCYLKIYHPKSTINFSLDYAIRYNSKAFLNQINFDQLQTLTARNMDEHFILNACRYIKNWFEEASEIDDKGKENPQNWANEMMKRLYNDVNVIWYEVENDEKSEDLFTRLNIGKIPLTNSELIRALFLSHTANSETEHKDKLLIALQWDEIEKALHNNRFWSFLTNAKTEQYPTRIDLLFDLYAKKTEDNKNKNYTFDHVYKQITQQGNKQTVWNQILRYYQMLTEWYTNSDLYHKIGFLIASNTKTLLEIIDITNGQPKSKIDKILNEEIAKSILFNQGYSDLSYDTPNGYKMIERILLLFNVETMRVHQQRFDFDKYKNTHWSLEHIHARQSEGLSTINEWKAWLSMHLQSLLSFSEQIQDITLLPDIESLIEQMTAYEKKGTYQQQFNDLFNRVQQVFSQLSGENDTGNQLSNMALLSSGNNAALNCSTFDVKRNKIIEMDKKGEYIPICTRNVFLKYYSDSSNTDLHFWSKTDRDNYINAINRQLQPYLQLINAEIKM